MNTVVSQTSPPKKSFLYDPKIRAAFYQILLVVIVTYLFYAAATNAIENLQRAKIASGFGFLETTAGFDISQTLIPFSAAGSSYGDAFLVGLLNTLVVSAIGIVFATILGFIIGIARLSSNWMVAKVAMVYVELLRNIPLLLQLLFWYIAVLGPLPQPRNSLEMGAGFFLNSRGLFMPRPLFASDISAVLVALVVGAVAALLFRRWAKKQQEATGRQYRVGRVTLALVLGLPLVTWLVLALTATNPITFDMPRKGTFNLQGGMQILPEFVALLVGLTTYTAAFIAEVVRAGILAVSKGQTEAAGSLGLKPGQTLRLVVVPQAMRVIIPPLTSQYLNLTKNSSLAVAIGYPDLVQVFMGTVLNQTGQAIEVVVITMGVYLTISLVTSFVMNIYNRRVAIVER
ncbi:amino acid ABC transporter permease [Microvirga sp. 17 mud 1-3]|uniref:amino acid ABC transporter permease n=1 Tax=Microvirga sp. 17 mud 1-3 TaxID=2082949 RepID=UPI000D6B075A|nr:amino acid ABC transporter permease [Microvirga sp. 17 mud 1-3]AWM87324.1 amino acid ABC transporter permease [Microvirga sp. 17 mud 1-3]